MFTNLEIMQYQYSASTQYWKTATEQFFFGPVNKQFGKTNKKIYHNLPTHFA
jgi:hypothetical protein